MKFTCEVTNDTYGTLIISGTVDYETVSASLESILTYDGDELLAYENGNPVGFSRADIAEMQTALVYRGLPVTK